MRFMLQDEASLFMVYMICIVLFLSFFFTLPFTSPSVGLSLFFLHSCCFMVFSTNSLFLIYLFYEASLLPILFIIVKWGSYPERSVRAFILLLYTAVFSLPFLVILFSSFDSLKTFNLCFYPFLPMGPSLLCSLIIFLAFAVKLPIYGIHFWLPIAHVEAPTFGSMILAGVLLKLGGVGLVRLSPVVDLPALSHVILSYLVIFLVFTTLVCCYQSDFKRLVAYSSVSHMIAIPLLLLAGVAFSFKRLYILIFFHGLSSPILFMLVGLLYSVFSTRQLVSIRGVLLFSPLLSFFLVIRFLFTLSAPPFPTFLAEVFFFISRFYLTSWLLGSFLLFSFLSLVYNLNWVSSIVFSSVSSTSPNMEYSIRFSCFYPMTFSLLVCIPILILVPFF